MPDDVSDTALSAMYIRLFSGLSRAGEVLAKEQRAANAAFSRAQDALKQAQTEAETAYLAAPQTAPPEAD